MAHEGTNEGGEKKNVVFHVSEIVLRFPVFDIHIFEPIFSKQIVLPLYLSKNTLERNKERKRILRIVLEKVIVIVIDARKIVGFDDRPCFGLSFGK